MAYRLNLGAWSGIFAVPCDIVDRQLRMAGPAQLKALLYILRHSDRAVEISELAQVCGVSQGDASDAVKYWQEEGIITGSDEQLAPPPAQPHTIVSADVLPEESVCASAPIGPAPPPSASTSSEPPRAGEHIAPAPKAKERIRYPYNECAEMMRSDPELVQMLGALEVLLAKNLNHTEISVFITLVKWYGLPPSCVALLVEYCRDIGRSTIAYIEATGIGWVNDDIITVEQVDQRIRHLYAARTAWAHVRSLLDIPERAPSKKENECCPVWINEWNMPDELIKLAYDRCIDSKGKLNISYMNGILCNWHKNGITTAAQAAEESAPSRKPAGGSGTYEATYEKTDMETVLDDDWMDFD